ncbi:coiled-coil domain-containing protein 124-like [Ostrea edulis]|uniref:coiled-coil domain-containing protein 124-like n=1 Tax=Ostrea edulis TaxID=37623 RepID=UPI0020954770|nr:coiled-coil domain-containing protein 124-like [Ostrea edulis]XP_048733915.1 coiled-coil domain-containing protein 124-like [Ostrea edulis]
MPKKFKGENSKAAEARAKKASAKAEADLKKQQAIEDEYWRDDDKHVAKKQQRKEDKEKKRLEQLERKKEIQKLHDEELASIKKPGPAPSAKITQADINKHVERERKMRDEASKKQKEDEEPPIEENLNRLQIDGQEARSVTEALSVLSDKAEEVDLHPEKRLKAAYKKYEEVNLPILKQENPNMKLSQLKQMLWKDWQKSPDNPLNQRLAAS